MMTVARNLLKSGPASATGRTYWIVLAMVAALLGLAATQAPALTLALVLLGLVLWGLVQGLLRRDYFNVASWVCLGYLGFAFGGLYYAVSGPLYEYGYFIYKDGKIQNLGLPVYASLAENQPYLILALLIAIIGLFSFGAGYTVFSRRDIKSGTHLTVEHRYSRRRLFVAVSFLSVGGLFFTHLFFESSGGLLYLLTHIYGRTVFRSSAYLNWGALLLPVASLLWFSYDYKRARKRPLFWLHMAFTSLVLVSFGDRWGVLGFWLMLTVIHYYLSGRKFKIRGLIVLGAAIVVISIAVGTWRYWSMTRNAAAIRSLSSVDQIAFDTFRTLVAGRNLTDIDVLTWIVGSGHEEIGWLGGKTFIQIIFAPIPRSLFPAKPNALGQIIFWNYTDTDIFNAWHPTFVGELYINFMLPGVFIGMFLLGVGSSWVEWRKWRSPFPFTFLLYAIFVVKFVVMLITVDILTSFLQVTFYMIPVVIASLYISRKRFRLSPSGNCLNITSSIRSRSSDRRIKVG